MILIALGTHLVLLEELYNVYRTSRAQTGWKEDESHLQEYLSSSSLSFPHRVVLIDSEACQLFY